MLAHHVHVHDHIEIFCKQPVLGRKWTEVMLTKDCGAGQRCSDHLWRVDLAVHPFVLLRLCLFCKQSCSRWYNKLPLLLDCRSSVWRLLDFAL
jgi:hypothetical protein